MKRIPRASNGFSLDSSVFLVVIKRADSRELSPWWRCGGHDLPAKNTALVKICSRRIGPKIRRYVRSWPLVNSFQARSDLNEVGGRFFIRFLAFSHEVRNTKDKDRRQRRWWWRLFLKYTLFPVRWLPETLTHISIFPIPFVADRKPRRIVCVESSHII